MARAQRVFYVRCVMEAESSNLAPSVRFARQQIIRALEVPDNVNLGVAIYDQNDVELLRMVYRKLGNPSPEMVELMEEEFGLEEDPEEKPA